MLSKSIIKSITALYQKKYRQAQNQFIVEGEKAIQEFINESYFLDYLIVTDDIFRNIANNKRFEASTNELKKISALHQPNNCLAVFQMPKPKPILANSLILMLDDIRDPGNLGTIIRLCDWFGITDLICSQETVDCYNPKVVQASMGSMTRVNISYLDLENYLEKNTLPVFGTFMNGENVYQTALPKTAILILGNEANGINANLAKLINKRISIPRFGKNQKTESLNVANATAILLSEFCRGY